MEEEKETGKNKIRRGDVGTRLKSKVSQLILVIIFSGTIFLNKPIYIK